MLRRLALFPGSFDPFTKGHADIVTRALALFDEIIVAVGYNEQKPGWMPVKERVEKIRKIYADEPRVKVESYTGLTVEFAKEKGVNAIVRGVRTVADFEYELQMADVNKQLTGIEIVLLPASPQFASLSSSVVRELAHFGQDISAFLP
ncbi:MAG: pantetheine-phosphate adenylyltransferase [Bacteroidaceae bacterium]|nr:pantetheine-phosphate adenylyltransferase [Bacteroidaceae bacterium]